MGILDVVMSHSLRLGIVICVVQGFWPQKLFNAIILDPLVKCIRVGNFVLVQKFGALPVPFPLSVSLCFCIIEVWFLCLLFYHTTIHFVFSILLYSYRNSYSIP